MSNMIDSTIQSYSESVKECNMFRTWNPLKCWCDASMFGGSSIERKKKTGGLSFKKLQMFEFHRKITPSPWASGPASYNREITIEQTNLIWKELSFAKYYIRWTAIVTKLIQLFFLEAEKHNIFNVLEEVVAL